MRVKTNAPESVDKDRGRYYKLRADKLELQNRLAREQYIHRDRIKTDLNKFCDAIAQKIGASDLEPELKAEISEDLADYLGRIHLPVTGPNGQHNPGQRHGRKAKNR